MADMSRELDITSINELKLDRDPEVFDHLPENRYEGLSCMGTFIPPVKCAICHNPFMLYTFYDGHHDFDDYYDPSVVGRTIICGSYNPRKIVRVTRSSWRLESVQLSNPPIEDETYEQIHVYVCDLCNDDHRKYGNSIYEIDCDDGFLFNNLDAGVMQNRVEQLNCSENCKGMCLLQAYSEYMNDQFHTVKKCSECSTSIHIMISSDYDELKRKAIHGEFINLEGVYVCSDVINKRNECDGCEESLELVINKGAPSYFRGLSSEFDSYEDLDAVPEDHIFCNRCDYTCPCLEHIRDLVFYESSKIQIGGVTIDCDNLPFKDRPNIQLPMTTQGDMGYVLNIAEGCIGPSCNGKCLDKYGLDFSNGRLTKKA